MKSGGNLDVTCSCVELAGLSQWKGVEMSNLILNPRSVESYRQFKAVKQLPSWNIRGRLASFPDEYAERIGTNIEAAQNDCEWEPSEFLFDYQSDISKMAVSKRKFAVFADCGLGKTLILLEFAQAAMSELSKQGKGFLIVSPLMVIEQTLSELHRWYPGLEIDTVRARNLPEWLKACRGKIGITNYEAITDDLKAGQLGGLALDESSMLKSHYGKWGTKLIELGKGLEWKACFTGTPAPNDRIEYANHAVFLDHFPTVNSFLATFFVNRGQTQERWALKDHALRPFYRALSHWAIFLTNPATYGWKDNIDTIPPIHTHIESVPLTDEQQAIFRSHTGNLFATDGGGICSRSTLGQIAKGQYKGKEISTNKPGFIRDMVQNWPGESSLIWCKYNAEQERLERQLPDAASVSGSTPLEARQEMIAAFKSGELRELISKPKIIGFGLNLQIATRQVFSTLQDSYEDYYQAVKRSNRVGSTKPLHVHIPITELEEPMAQNVLRKAAMVQADTEQQERIFNDAGKRF